MQGFDDYEPKPYTPEPPTGEPQPQQDKMPEPPAQPDAAPYYQELTYNPYGQDDAFPAPPNPSGAKGKEHPPVFSSPAMHSDKEPASPVDMHRPVSMAPAPDPVYANGPALPPSGGGDSFYTETIRKDKPKSKGKFVRTLVLICVLAIPGIFILGLGLGAGGKLAEEYILPMITGKQNPAEEKIDFSFEKSTPSSSMADVPVEEVLPAFNPNSDASFRTYADIINKVEPSVVSISATVMQQSGFFGGFGGITDGSMESGIPVQGSGSGILFYESDSKYYIVTNNHVVQSAKDIRISILNSEPIPAGVVGTDPYNDLAVIYIDKADVQKAGVNRVVLASFGDSDDMQVGDMVLAIGNALGEGNTATNGIISAKDKEIVVEGLKLTVLQTNAAINPGNSGGPLVNLKGEVIGINTAKISQSNTEGMGYSIPSNIAKPIIQEFMDSINKPYMGVQIYSLTAEMAAQYNLPTAGALVRSVVEGSPAERAGIKPTDIITGFNGQPILTAEQLTESVQACQIGDVVEIKVIRDGKEHITLKITLERRL